MQISTFLSPHGGSPQVGIAIAGGRIIALADALALCGSAAQTAISKCGSVRSVIEHHEVVMPLAAEILSERARFESVSFAADQVELLAPLPDPATIYCVGLNYAPHSVEFQGSNSTLPTNPVIFTKQTAVTGPGAPIDIHSDITSKVDYEAEFAVIIGTSGTNIRAEDAERYVFGYTCLNDVTSRDLQSKHSQWLIGKSLDGFCPMGPVIVDRSELPWPPAVTIEGIVNSEIRQSDNTSSLIFSVPTLIECLSAGRQLRAGDVIATGTPAGTGMGMNPPQFLGPGDQVAVRIEGIGELLNYCV
jgi:2-keto-4-pentenoate hydratase/2-oxohepta-3-ene-1,7-dioic acid hydratase in catechol pathway